MGIYFDVGANDGSSSQFWKDQGHTVYAFEPNPWFHQTLIHRGYNLCKAAVSDFNGKAKFHVCDTHDRGCSSLLEVSEAGKTEWGGRTDMLPVTEIEVDVIRLDTFMQQNSIEWIDYLHCDAQGSDLAVLKGLGSMIDKVRAGVVEAAQKYDILYVGQNTAEETMTFLTENGFRIERVLGNDVQGNEINISFIRV